MGQRRIVSGLMRLRHRNPSFGFIGQALIVDGIVTHTFDLPEWKRALETASAGPNASAVKTTLRPNTEIPLVD